ncbi:hypothetical protein [Aestuariivita boseongensis]|uniref:hypothetical protein n=1 Tax=Aestuariivita boseongensis TaxID=1470562 RepID=UPI0006814D94|nr:hypothetical protein [Aestuariivita boseongensis]
MRLYVDAKQTDPKLIGWNNGLNYGQMSRFQPNQIFHYAMVFSREEFLARFSEMFARQAAEFKRIDAEDGDEPTAFSVFDYGSLEHALQHGQALYECFDDHMMTDAVLPHLWPGGGEGRLIINSLDRVEVSSGQGRVILEGRGWNGRVGEMPSEDWLNGQAYD